ncbi:perilipin 6 [Sander lucioperca]|uniref:perilipin 6 n=1 Tax=Sander lucioperca TaxID=283035 RepID=UPI001653D6EA|nr:perilipin 6 [Sander lucioperca]
MSQRKRQESSAVLRVSALPLVHSALQSVTSAYSNVKGRYPLLALVGGVAEVGVRSASHAAMTRATPLLQSLQPQIEVANSLALVGLERLERHFPVLHQSTDEVLGHLKDALFLTLDDVQLWLLDGVDGAVDQLERATDAALAAVRLLQDMPAGRAAATGLDNALSRLEDATAYYLPLPPQLRVEWERRVKEFDDEEEDDEEPGVWTRLRSLLLSLSLQLYDRLLALHNAAHQVGLGWVLQTVWELLQNLQRLLAALAYRAERLRELTMRELRGWAAMLAELRPVRQIRELPLQIQQPLADVMELSQMLLQLVINGTPLYDMLQQPSAQEVEDFLNQDFTAHGSSHRRSANSLFLKAMDGRPRRPRSRAAQGSMDSQTPDPLNGCQRSSLKELMALKVEEQPPAQIAESENAEKAEIAESENAKIAESENAEIAESEKAKMAESKNAENAEIAESENTEKAEIAESEKAENAKIAESEKAEMAEYENTEKAEIAESKNAENAKIAESEKAEMAESENTEKAEIAESEKAENGGIAESKNAENAKMAESEKAEMAESENAEKAEIAESENAEMAESKNARIAESENTEKAEIAEYENTEKAEIAESEKAENAEIAESKNAEIAESKNARIAESENAENAEIAETGYEKKDENADMGNDEKADDAELLLTPQLVFQSQKAFEDPTPDSPDNAENDDNAEAGLSSRAARGSADCGLKVEEPSSAIAHRRPSAAELLLAPLKQFVSQSQKVFELLSPDNAENAESAETDEDVERLLEPLKQFVSQSQKTFELLSPDNADNAENAEIAESKNTDDTDSGRASADC